MSPNRPSRSATLPSTPLPAWPALALLLLTATTAASTAQTSHSLPPRPLPTTLPAAPDCPPDTRHSVLKRFPSQDMDQAFSIPGTTYPGPLTHDSHWYQGIRCNNHSEYPKVPGDCGPRECPWPGTACYLNSPCTMWESGSFSWPTAHAHALPVATRPPDSSTQRSCTAADDLDTDGFFMGDVWSTAAPCRTRWFSPPEAAGCLAGRRLTFIGDSIVRQLYHRLIYYLRGFPQMAEQLYHFDSHYVHNGTYDEFQPGQRLPPRPRRKERARDMAGGGGTAEGAAAGGFEVEFLWRPRGSIHHHELVHTQPDVLVYGINYWGDDGAAVLTPDWLQRVDADVDLYRLLWLTVPKYVRHDAGLTSVNRTLLRAYAARNAAMRALLRGVPAARVVPVDRLSAASPWERNSADQLHWMCGIEGELCVDCAHRMGQDFKNPPDGDCRDLLNLNVLQLILNNICPPEAAAPAPEA